jgi:hypothetical protein
VGAGPSLHKKYSVFHRMWIILAPNVQNSTLEKPVNNRVCGTFPLFAEEKPVQGGGKPTPCGNRGKACRFSTPGCGGATPVIARGLGVFHTFHGLYDPYCFKGIK